MRKSRDSSKLMKKRGGKLMSKDKDKKKKKNRENLIFCKDRK
jgi:hypothetical protein